MSKRITRRTKDNRIISFIPETSQEIPEGNVENVGYGEGELWLGILKLRGDVVIAGQTIPVHKILWALDTDTILNQVASYRRGCEEEAEKVAKYLQIITTLRTP